MNFQILLSNEHSRFLDSSNFSSKKVSEESLLINVEVRENRDRSHITFSLSTNQIAL